MLIKHWKRGRNLEFPFDTDFSFFEKTGGLAPIQRFELWPVTVNRLELVEMLRYRIKNKSTAAKAVPLGHWCETTFVPQLIGHWHLKFNAQHKQRTWRKARSEFSPAKRATVALVHHQREALLNKTGSLETSFAGMQNRKSEPNCPQPSFVFVQLIEDWIGPA